MEVGRTPRGHRRAAPPPGTALVPDASSVTSRSSTNADALDDLAAHGRIDANACRLGAERSPVQIRPPRLAENPLLKPVRRPAAEPKAADSIRIPASRRASLSRRRETEGLVERLQRWLGPGSGELPGQFRPFTARLRAVGCSMRIRRAQPWLSLPPVPPRPLDCSRAPISGVTRSMGSGKTIVEFWFTPNSSRVWR
jgi:hypothetical protein